MFKWIKNLTRPKTGGGEEKVTETGELPADASVEIDGQQVKLNELVAAHKAKAAPVAAPAPAETPGELSGDTEIEVGEGQTVKLNELVDAHKAQTAAAAKLAEDAQKLNARTAGAKSFKVLAEAPARAAAFKVTTTGSSGSRDEAVARGTERYGSGKHAAN